MNSIKFNDWQDMALKKDTEEILKKIDAKEPVLFSVCWEIVLAVASILIDHLFDTQSVDTMIWVIVAVAAVFPPVIVLAINIVKFMKKLYNIRIGNYSVEQFVDLFDNKLCYWAMTSNSYAKMLENMKYIDMDERIFAYQEGCYYDNKAIAGLYSMLPVLDKVFTENIDILHKEKVVALQRLISIELVIAKNQKLLSEAMTDKTDDERVKEQIKVNSYYNKLLTVLQKQQKEIFHVNIEEKHEY